MAGDGAQASLVLVPGSDRELPAIDRGRPLVGVAASLIALAALVPAFVFLAPRSVWEPEDLFVLLLGFGFVSYSAAVPLTRTATLDAGFAVALIALVFLGPLPAALAFSAPEVGRWLEGHPTHRFIGNVASFGWAVLLAGLVLDALASEAPVQLDAGAYAAVVVAGAVMVLVNYTLTTVLIQGLHDGVRLRVAFVQELLPSSPVSLALIGAALVTIFLYDQLGIPGLAPLALMLLAPRLLAPGLLRRKPVSELPRSAATAAYAEAIADELGLDRGQKRVLCDAASHLGGSASLTRMEDFTAVMEAVLHCRERWDGKGGSPGLLSGETIPLESRVLAVADAWSELTAAGTRGLTTEQALHDLRAGAGAAFDPTVVAAAVKTVRDRSLSLDW
jgi:HD domain